MEQRRLRLGDIVDDYCPRERRVTNHAIVAMIEEDIRQTRCTTCDAEHAYKGAKVPRRRKKDAPTLVVPGADAASVAPGADAASIVAAAAEPSDEAVPAEQTMEPSMESEERFEPEPAATAIDPDAGAEEPPPPALEDGPVHRPLIRATLPRPEGQKTERPLPDFTMRHANGRGGNQAYRGNGRPKMRSQGGNGNRAHGRFSGPRQGPGRGGPHAGFRSGPPRHGGKKRSR